MCVWPVRAVIAGALIPHARRYTTTKARLWCGELGGGRDLLLVARRSGQALLRPARRRGGLRVESVGLGFESHPPSQPPHIHTPQSTADRSRPSARRRLRCARLRARPTPTRTASPRTGSSTTAGPTRPRASRCPTVRRGALWDVRARELGGRGFACKAQLSYPHHTQ